MATVEFGNVSADMRLEDDSYGIPAVQAFDAFLTSFVPVREEVLEETPTSIVIRQYDAGGGVITISAQGDVANGQFSSFSVEAVGVIEYVSGNFTVDAFGNLFGTATGIRANLVQDGSLIARIAGISVPVNTENLFDLPSDETLLSNADTITAGAGNDYLLGYGGNDSLLGGLGNDTLNGGAGNDTMRGGAGNDTYVVNAVGDMVTEGSASGSDIVKSSAAFTLGANVEKLTLTGTGAINGTGNTLNNTITGNSGANQLAGGGGTDTLTGNDGADTLDGGGGNDTLIGGGGNDVLIHQAADTSVQGGTGTDTLRINGGGVVLDLTLIANTVHTDIEKIDLTGSGDNTLTLARSDVLAISSTTDTLKIIGNAGDTVNAGSGWTDIGVSGAVHEYHKSGAILLVDSDITQNIFA